MTKWVDINSSVQLLVQVSRNWSSCWDFSLDDQIFIKMFRYWPRCLGVQILGQLSRYWSGWEYWLSCQDTGSGIWILDFVSWYLVIRSGFQIFIWISGYSFRCLEMGHGTGVWIFVYSFPC